METALLENVTTSADQTEFELPQGAVAVFTGVILSIQMIASLPCNLLILYLIASNKKLRSLGVNCIIFNLCVGELVFQATFCLGNMYYFFMERNELICQIVGYIEAVLITVSGDIYALLAFNRYLAFFHEELLERYFTARNTVILLITSQVGHCCVAALLFPYMGYESTHFCGFKANQSQFAFRLAIVGICCEIAGTFPLMLYCNFAVVRKLRALKSKMAKRNFESLSVSRAMFQNVQHMLYYHMTVSFSLEIPGLVARFIPGIEHYPWIGRSVGLLISMEPCVTPCVILYLIGPLTDGARDFLKRHKLFKRNVVAHGGVSKELV